MNKCLVCAHWDWKATPSAMRAHGFAICALGKRWEYLSPLSSCPKFKEADGETRETRIKWAQKHKLMETSNDQP